MPQDQSPTMEGETTSNCSSSDGCGFAHYNFGYKPGMGTLIFDANGRVKDFNRNQCFDQFCLLFGLTWKTFLNFRTRIGTK